jgi:4-amino-4-deoxy-L-arabinose transferase-like glycosyltransferase
VDQNAPAVAHRNASVWRLPKERLWRPWPASLVLAILAAAVLRLAPLLANRFHPDEALYAYFARLIASGHDPMLAGVLVDKPPAAFYLMALSILAIGPSELAVRLPELAAGLASVALLYALGRRLYDPVTGRLAAWLLALSPFAILFSITAFVDPLLTAAVLWALWAASAGRWRHMAIAVAAGFALKQTVLVFVPLCLALALLAPPLPTYPGAALRRMAIAAWPLVPALVVAAVLIFGWDALRHSPVSFWSQGYLDNIPGRLVRANEVLPRGLAWLNQLHYFTGSTSLNLLFVLCLPLLLIWSRSTPNRAAVVDCVLAGYLLLYLAVYWLLAFNVWDRYLLPVLPIWLLLLARVLRLGAYSLQRAAFQISRRLNPRDLGFRRTLALALPAALLALAAPGAALAARSAYPIGGDHGAFDGIDGAARFIRTLPQGSVLYDHWLSWEWNYYLFGGPVYVAWFPSPDALAVDLKSFGATSPRFLAVPAWEGETEVRSAAAEAGFDFVAVYTAYRRDGVPTIVVYALKQHPPAGAAPSCGSPVTP